MLERSKDKEIICKLLPIKALLNVETMTTYAENCIQIDLFTLYNILKTEYK